MKKRTLKLLVGITLAMVIIACSTDRKDSEISDSALTDTPVVQQTASDVGVKVGGAMMVPSKNIIENAMSSTDHTTLVAAVKQAGLVETLSGSGPFTVFAPTNEAFDKLPKSTLSQVMKLEKKSELTKILAYHVVPGSIRLENLTDGQILKTMQGGTLKVSVKNNIVKINGANVTIGNVVSSNGITHVVDQVLLPK